MFAEKFNVMFCNLTLCSGAQPLPPGEHKIITLKHWNVAPGEKTHNTQHTTLLPLRLAGDIYFIAAQGFQHKTIMNVSIKIPIQLSPRPGFCFRWPKLSEICTSFDWAPAEQHRRGLYPVKLVCFFWKEPQKRICDQKDLMLMCHSQCGFHKSVIHGSDSKA